MKVMLDARMAFHSGIGRYIRCLSRELLRQSPGLILALLIDPREAGRAQQDIGQADVIPFPAKIYSLQEQAWGSWLCRVSAKRASLFHFPHYNVPWFLPRNSVVTVHDLTHFQFPQSFGRLRAGLALKLLRRGVRRATQLIAVSHATRQALETMLPEARGKTTVIYHGVEEQFRPLSPLMVEHFKRRTQGGRFFLYVGSAKPHKNLPRLLEAFGRVRARHRDLSLVLLGVDPPGALNHVQGVRAYRQVGDSHLALWYNAAEALVFPSLNEGFGLPALEAMACGTPVLASNVASLPEVVGDAGLLVNPWDTDAWAQEMERLLLDSSLRHDLRAKGLQRASQFSWVTAAEQTLKLYREVAVG